MKNIFIHFINSSFNRQKMPLFKRAIILIFFFLITLIRLNNLLTLLLFFSISMEITCKLNLSFNHICPLLEHAIGQLNAYFVFSTCFWIVLVLVVWPDCSLIQFLVIRIQYFQYYTIFFFAEILFIVFVYCFIKNINWNF